MNVTSLFTRPVCGLVAVMLTAFSLRPAHAQAQGGYPIETIEVWVKAGIPPERIWDRYVSQRGISFAVDDAAEARLRRAGADTETIRMLKRARVVVESAPEPVSRPGTTYPTAPPSAPSLPASQPPPPAKAASHPHEIAVMPAFVGAYGFGGTPGSRPLPAGKAFAARTYYGGTAEAGFMRKGVGLRGKYGVLQQENSDSLRSSPTQFASGEAVVEVAWSERTSGVFVAVGPAWLWSDSGSPTANVPGLTASLGYRRGSRRLSLVIEGSYIANHVPFILVNSPRPSALGDPRAQQRFSAEGDLILVSIGIRLH